MVPVGSYQVFVEKLKKRENIEIPITIGVLIADFRQTKCREYIINYMNRFNDVSWKYIDFYIPGYIKDEYVCDEPDMVVNEKNYSFNDFYFDEFQSKLVTDFNIDYAYNPRLILIEYFKGHFRTSRKIIVELDNSDSDIKRTGELFEELFTIAKSEIDISRISQKLTQKNITSNFLDKVIQSLGSSFLNSLNSERKIYERYRLKK